MNEGLNLLAPAAVLVLWTIIVLFWMAGSRLSAMNRIGVDLGNAGPGGRGADLEAALPASVNWKSHNYTHLLEQPTLFYAVVLILHVSGGTTPLTVGLAWGYTLIRIVHSIWQATVNRIPVRFALFLASTTCLTVLAVLAVIITLG